VSWVTGGRGGDTGSKSSVSAKLWYVVPEARDSDLSSMTNVHPTVAKPVGVLVIVLKG
jgi:hypothetical protein